jgi:putative SOS response-associated peptidase YedK
MAVGQAVGFQVISQENAHEKGLAVVRGTKSKPVPGPHQVYGFLTTAPNAIVEPIHPKAMPVILTTDEERDVWMRAHRGTRPRHCSGHCRMTL